MSLEQRISNIHVDLSYAAVLLCGNAAFVLEVWIVFPVDFTCVLRAQQVSYNCSIRQQQDSPSNLDVRKYGAKYRPNFNIVQCWQVLCQNLVCVCIVL